jgi:hypothetical protein
MLVDVLIDRGTDDATRERKGANRSTGESAC